MDDISEQQQLANEITTAISNPVGFDQDIDEVNDHWISQSNKELIKFYSSKKSGWSVEGVARTTRSRCWKRIIKYTKCTHQ